MDGVPGRKGGALAWRLSIIALAITAAAILVLVFAGEEPPERDKLQGKWKVIGSEENGIQIPAEIAAKIQMVFTFKGATLIFGQSGVDLMEFTFVLTPGKQSGGIDLIHKNEANVGKACHGIYALDGDDLKLCFANFPRFDEPADRPKVFSTKKAANAGEKIGKLLLVLKREK